MAAIVSHLLAEARTPRAWEDSTNTQYLLMKKVTIITWKIGGDYRNRLTGLGGPPAFESGRILCIQIGFMGHEGRYDPFSSANNYHCYNITSCR